MIENLNRLRSNRFRGSGNYAGVEMYCVDPVNGDDTHGDGTWMKPVKTVQDVINNRGTTGKLTAAVMVRGPLTESLTIARDNFKLIGGGVEWEKNASPIVEISVPVENIELCGFTLDAVNNTNNFLEVNASPVLGLYVHDFLVETCNYFVCDGASGSATYLWMHDIRAPYSFDFKYLARLTAGNSRYAIYDCSSGQSTDTILNLGGQGMISDTNVNSIQSGGKNLFSNVSAQHWTLSDWTALVNCKYPIDETVNCTDATATTLFTIPVNALARYPVKNGKLSISLDNWLTDGNIVNGDTMTVWVEAKLDDTNYDIIQADVFTKGTSDANGEQGLVIDIPPTDSYYNARIRFQSSRAPGANAAIESKGHLQF